MEPWRSRGYVPDSDDEEDLESQLTWEKKHVDVPDINLEDEAHGLASQDEDDKREQGKGIAKQHLPSLKLTPGRQAELVVCFDTGRDEIDSSEDELQVIDVVSKTSTAERTTKSSEVLIEAILSNDESDSPLSSAPSTDSSQENQFLTAQQNIEDHEIQPQRPDSSPPETPRANTRPEIESSNTTLLDARRDNESEVSYWARRSLRQRKEIQLHPYQVEIARHRNQFKSAGIKPVHVTVEDANPSRQQQESQEDSVVEAEPSSSQASEFIFPRSSPPDPYKSPNSITRRRTPKAGSHQTLPRAEDHVQKRRKLFHETSRAKQVDQASVSVVIEQTHKSINEKNNLPFTEIPPSPPRSGSTSSNTRLSKDGFRFPRGFTPPVLSESNTPIRTTSPDFHDLTTEKADFDILSNLDDQISVQSLEEEESDHDDDNDNVESRAPEKDVQEYQRRIKGVLPASWLTLDLKNKTGKPDRSSNEKHARGPLASVTGPQKGVARPINRQRSTAFQSPTPRAPLTFLHDSSDSDDRDESITTNLSVGEKFLMPSKNSPKVYDLTNISDDDILEDNGLDELFPQIPRLFSGRKHANSSISRTYKRKKVSYENQERQRNPLHRQMRLDEDSLRASVRKIPKSTVPKLSILDVPNVNSMPPSKQPQFLRIAMRQARSRKDQGRSSPNRKIFRMATREETKETNKMLGDWKNGTMKQALLRRPSKPERQPLQHLSTNSSVTAERATTDDLLPVINTQTPNSKLSHIQSARPSPSHTTTGSSSKRRIVAAASKQPKLVKRSILNRAITSLTRDTARPAVSEIVAAGSKPTHDCFSASLAAIQKTDRNRMFTLERFLAAMETNKQSLTQPFTTIAETTSTRPSATRQARDKLPKKRIPIRAEVIDVDPMPGTSCFSLPFKSLSRRLTSDMNDSTKIFQVFRDTESFTIDFDILPIRKETFFHSSTFIGDGAFSSSLNISRRNMDLGAGFATTTYRDRILRWGPWNEQVASELTEIFDGMKVDIARNQLSDPDPRMDYTPILSFIIRWITGHLHFVETMDRVLFVDFMKSLVCNLANQIDECGSTSGNHWMIHSSLLSLNLILANQVRQITNHEKVDSSMRKSILDVLRDLSRQLLTTICSHNGLKNIRKLYEASRDPKFQESGIRDGFPAVEAYIILLHVLRSSDITRGWLNELLVALLAPKIPIADFQRLEDSWMVLFTLIPLNEFDELGLGRPGIRFREKYDNWPLVQSLVMAVFNLYLRDPNQPMRFLKYCRFVLQRCLLLLMSWGWRDCRDLLSTLFEFYAKNMMYNLKNEHSFGSPAFLEDLDSNPAIEIEPSDSSFHLFLKIIGSGLRYLSQSYDTKAMRNMTWRLLPNHGRAYPKEKPLDHEDLDALRNHHDLLCTLYWAVPDSCRPRLQTIRDLIDPATSHLETCNLSIRSWRRLVHFKLSTNEEDAGLKPFAEWYRMFMEEVVRQHQLAKTETEAQARDQILFSKQDVEVTVSHNQRRIEAVISSAIAAMDSAVQSSRSFNQACLLVDGVPFAKVFDLFDPTNPRVNPIISDTLQLAIHFLSKDMSLTASGSHTENDDSQEYGDWSAIEEAYDVEDTEKEAPVEAFPLLREVLLPCVAHLLSNCFGEDRCPDDVFLVNVTECWSCIAHASVKNGLQHWDSYLNPYSKISWAALRLTPQTKQFGPRFVATCVEKDQNFYVECRLQILTMWASCVVEKKSALKFQHLLTETLLNVDETPLMRNLPFHRKSDGRYHVSTLEFSERRISLISSLFSNMREHLQSLETSDSGRSNVLNEYREILNAFMTAMKLNHQELAQSETEAQSQYVTFVQSVISFMQQHTQSICRLDRYFTDPATFPLPSGDPGYVAAKLKSYGVRLPSLSAGKELIGFVQGICQSAAVGDKQAELIDQLCDSMSEAYESGNEKAPTLRSFLFHCVFPIYIECALSNAAAWILAVPITKVVCRSSRDLLYEMDINDRDSVASVNSMSCAILQGVENLLLVFFSYTDFTGMPQAPLLLRSCMDMALSLLPVLDYIGRNDLRSDSTESILGRLHKQTTIIVERLLEPSSPRPFDHNAVPPQESVRDSQSSTLFTDSRAFAKREIQSSLRKNWSKHGGRYFVLRGGESTEVKCELVSLSQTADDESTISSFLNMANDFLSRWSDSEQLDYQYFSGFADEADAIHELDDLCI